MRVMLRIAMSLAVVVIIVASCASSGEPRSQTTGTVVTREEIARYPGQPLARILERVVLGLVVTRTSDGGYALRIRGNASFTERDAFPLYILDGAPIPTGPEGAMPVFDPVNIESIRVLKSTEAAVYGIDGANGVIIITMRKGPST